jgi:hypothetical protein
LRLKIAASRFNLVASESGGIASERRMLTTTGAAVISTAIGFNLISPPTPDLPLAALAAGLRQAQCSLSPHRAKVLGGEWLGRDLQIVEVSCGRTARGMSSILFAVPTGQPDRSQLIDLQDWRDGRIVHGHRVLAPAYDRDSRTLSSTQNIGSDGDCGTIKEWEWTGWSFRLAHVWSKTACDGEQFEWESREHWQVFPKPTDRPRQAPAGLGGVSPSKCPDRCNSQSRTRLGSPASAQMAKNQAQPVASAMKPAPDDR